MDNFTQSTKNWLEDRYLQVDENGVYIPHQPIYGLRKGISDPSLFGRYTITYQILKALSNLNFSSLLDVGGAEGYKAALIKKLFNVEVCSSDLSEEACKRAKEIFNIKGVQGDIHNLPFNDQEFDVVLCSETLEHVTNIKEATIELLRIAKNAVIITVPHESQSIVDRNIKGKIPHTHIHALDESSFDFVKDDKHKLIFYKFYHKYLKIISLIIDGIPRKEIRGVPHWGILAYNILMKISKQLFGKRTFGAIINFDDLITNEHTRLYNGLCFVIIKNTETYSPEKSSKELITQMLEFSVPLFYLKR